MDSDSDGTQKFLSTLPARGATYYRRLEWMHVLISIHAPREGSDMTSGKHGRSCIEFLSTLPARGATQPAAAGDLDRVISIHAPREGSDMTLFIS